MCLLPWIDPELESHRLTDNLRRVIAMMKKVHDVVHEEGMPMVDQAYMDMVEQGFTEEIPRNELHLSWRSYYLSTRAVIRKGAAITKCRIVGNASQVDQNDKSRTLNKMLRPSPNTLPQIMELIMHFMTFEYVLLIDIQKMFLSIELELKSDRDML